MMKAIIYECKEMEFRIPIGKITFGVEYPNIHVPEWDRWTFPIATFLCPGCKKRHTIKLDAGEI